MPFAPSIIIIGRKNNCPNTVTIIPNIVVKQISIVKYSFALSFLPSPNVLATIALPPVPIINPTVTMPIKKGIIKLIAAKCVFPTKLETNKPSTTPYIEVHIIISIEGNTNFNNLLYLKWSDNCILIIKRSLCHFV